MTMQVLTKLNFHISKMDCPSEEMMIRQTLAGIDNRLPVSLQYDFDLAGRNLAIFSLYHQPIIEEIIQKLDSIRLGSELQMEQYFFYYHIQKMDCPSEQAMIQQALSTIESIDNLDFDLINRTLIVSMHPIRNNTHHKKPVAEIPNKIHQTITNKLDQLKLASQPSEFNESMVLTMVSALSETSQISGTESSSCCGGGCQSEQQKRKETEQAHQRKLLWQVLIINGAFFVIEMSTGLLANSMGLIADSLDMLADASVYGMSLFAVGATAIRQKQVAKLAGWLQIGLALLGLAEVIRRFVGLEAVPNFATMIVVSALALIANALCLFLLNKSQSKQAHIQASQIFTSNDIIINLGVMTSAVLVWWIDSPIPDLLIGCLVFIIVFNGARRILQLAK